MKFNLVVFPNIEYQQNLWKIYGKVDLWIKKKRKLIMAMWPKIEAAGQLLVKPSISNSC
jgi:hypothetical protein